MTSRADLGRLASMSAPQTALARSALTFTITLFALLAFAAAFALAYGALHAQSILPGVTVGGVRLEGLERAGAAAELRRSLPNLHSGALTVRIGDQEQVISYAVLGRDYDMAGMLDQAFAVGRAGSPFDQLGHQMRTLFQGVDVPLVVKWDAGLLAQRVTDVARSVEAEPISAAITRPDGRFEVSPAVAGRAVDEAAAVESAMAALGKISAADTTINVAVESIPAQVETAPAKTAAERANRVADEPLNLSAGAAATSISAAAIRGWVHLQPVAPGEWRLLIEPAAVAQAVDQIKSQVDVPATNASFEMVGRDVTVVPSATGSKVDREPAIAAVLGALEARADGSVDAPADAPVSLATLTVQPELGTAEARSLVGRVQRLSRWTTYYDSSALNGFGQNIRRPTNLINGTVVQPGEVFDFVAVAGPIDEANGYIGGAAIIRGNTVLDGVLGGGLCSTSTTLFNAALRAGFEIGARRNHSYFIDRYPVGLDATIWINGRRVQTMSFTNDSRFPVLIRGINREGSVTFELWGVPDGRRVTLSTPRVWDEQEAWTKIEYTDDLPAGRTERVEYAFNGFDSEVVRTVTAANGALLHENTFISAYRRVIGHIRVGRAPGDPKAGTIVEPDPPPS